MPFDAAKAVKAAECDRILTVTLLVALSMLDMPEACDTKADRLCGITCVRSSSIFSLFACMIAESSSHYGVSRATASVDVFVNVRPPVTVGKRKLDSRGLNVHRRAG